MLTLRPGQMGGSETYARGLVRALGEHGTLEYVCFVPRAAPDAGDGLRTVVVGEYRDAGTPMRKAAAMALAALRPAPILRRFGRLAAVHYPFTIPLPQAPAPTAITLQDLLHLERPELWSRRSRAFRALAYDRPARRARLVIVPTEYVRRRVSDRLDVPLERIRAVHYGVDHDVFRPGDERREPFLLYPARPWRHKNHARLFQAFALVRRQRPELELVLTGGGHAARELPPGVRVEGLVTREQLASLYRRAAALVFPSLYEGFGYPPLEAMACGCPVAASTATSLPEICGDAAVMFDAESAEEMADAVLRALDDDGGLRERGLRRVASFTWKATADAHEAAYRELIAA